MSTVKTARKLGAFIAPTANTKPTSADYDPTTIVRRVERVVGAGMARAVLESDLASQGRRLRDMSLSIMATKQVEIWEIDPEDETDIRQTPLFWGEIVGQKITLRDGVEVEILEARAEPYHFGSPVYGPTMRIGGQPVMVRQELEFNPQVDGQIVPNMWEPTGHAEQWKYWIDTESTRSPAAIKHQDSGGTAVNQLWTLDQIARTLCHRHNSLDHIDNPDDLDYSTQLESAPEVRNLVLKTAVETPYLPDVLDAVLNKHQRGWYLACNGTGNDMTWKVKFYTLMDGTHKTVLMQPPGERLSLQFTDTESFDMRADVGRLATTLVGQGALVERQMTIPLMRSWPVADNAAYDHENPNNTIQRKWVANEGGDYIGIREEITEPTILDPDWLVKRRVLEDCLSYRREYGAGATEFEIGQRRHPVLEWRADSEAGWAVVPKEWGWRLLHDQIGVQFTGQAEPGATDGIPEEILTSTAELRITGTVRGDTRLEYIPERPEFTPNSNTVVRVVDLSDRFFDRQIQADGDFASVITDAGDERDDTEALQDYIDSIAEEAALTDIAAEITLFGLHLTDEYELGDIITKLEGREISLNRKAGEGAGKYVQIVGISYLNETGRQATVLTVSPHGVA